MLLLLQLWKGPLGASSTKISDRENHMNGSVLAPKLFLYRFSSHVLLLLLATLQLPFSSFSRLSLLLSHCDSTPRGDVPIVPPLHSRSLTLTQLLVTRRAHRVTITFSLCVSRSRSHSQLYTIWFSFPTMKALEKKMVRSTRAEGPATILAIGNATPLNCVEQSTYSDYIVHVYQCHNLDYIVHQKVSTR
ncbi:hypothetical protein JHK85_035866 [Glycine max]|nr:hypothetical protein JHK85_035866 [Glycine max]